MGPAARADARPESDTGTDAGTGTGTGTGTRVGSDAGSGSEAFAFVSTSEREQPTSPTSPLAPRAPEFYGFVAWTSTYLLFVLYLLWAFLPDELILALGVAWYPNRCVGTPAFSSSRPLTHGRSSPPGLGRHPRIAYRTRNANRTIHTRPLFVSVVSEWSLLIPAYGMVLVLLTYFTYFALALAGTPAFSDMRTITAARPSEPVSQPRDPNTTPDSQLPSLPALWPWQHNPSSANLNTPGNASCATDSKAHLPPAADDTDSAPAQPQRKSESESKSRNKHNPYLAHASPDAIPELYDIPLGLVNRVIFGPRRRRAPTASTSDERTSSERTK
ncbi:hypothetical protein C8T65DRAFT_672121 [Cerioporus squamosus]|nr:hypothetical protein C8T65DRAFT_672121 [Cerioporus squamosus]